MAGSGTGNVEQIPPAPMGTRNWLRATARGLHAWGWGIVALLFGLALTTWIGHVEWGREHRDQERAFKESVDAIEFALRSELQACELVMRSMQSLYLASERVLPDEFASAYENLEVRRQLPSLQALSFAERSTDEASGEAHFIIRQVEPHIPSNEGLVGLDINGQPASLAAARKSHDTDEMVMSAPFRLAQAPRTASTKSGMVLRLPVFAPGRVPTTVDERRMRIRGSLGASFMIETLARDALEDAAGSRMQTSLYDVTDGARILLYRNRDNPPETNALRASREISFGQRTWRLELVSAITDNGMPAWLRIVLIGGVSSLLFGALAWSVAGTRRHAIELAQTVGDRYRASEERFRHLNELLPTLVILFDRESGTVTYANQVARHHLGIPETGTPFSAIVPDRVVDRLAQAGPGQQITSEVQMRSIRGHEFWASIVASQIELDGRPKWLMVATDVSEQRRLTERLSYEASHDALTRLLNRQEFESRLHRALMSSDASLKALLFIDLDQFKLINDTSGHMAGDQLLVQLSMTMQEQLRDHDVLARLGGDEFGVLLEGVADREEAMRIAENLRLAIDGYVFVWDNRSYITTASIGGTLFHARSAPLKELLAQVDTACYTAKDAGRNRVHFYSDDDAASQIRRGEMDWVNRIRWALEESRLVLAYQEIQSIPHAKNDDVRIELLLRLSDEEGRLVLPGAFLPAAERYGLMPRIDRWVIDTALANFDRIHPAGKGLKLCSINLSAASLEDDDLIDFILEAIERHEIDPRRIMFEITENVAVRDLGRASRLISCLRAAGCCIALDDFGAGMSSFGYLKNLGIDTIKIDGAFVLDLEHDAVSHSIVRAITEIGHQHGLDVVAEWVGNPAQVKVLAGLGVDYVQGFGIHRPQLAQLDQFQG